MAHLAADSNYSSAEQATRTPANSQGKRSHFKGAVTACTGIPFRKGFIDKVQQKAMIEDGAKLADDILALPVWAAAPLVRFKTIGIHLSMKRKDTDALDG